MTTPRGLTMSEYEILLHVELLLLHTRKNSHIRMNSSN